jgi:hypothetical protein
VGFVLEWQEPQLKFVDIFSCKLSRFPLVLRGICNVWKEKWRNKPLSLPFNCMYFAKSSLKSVVQYTEDRFLQPMMEALLTCGSILSVRLAISLRGSCKGTNPVCHYRLGAEGHPRPGRPLQGEESGSSWRHVLRPLLGVRQWAARTLRLPQWPRVCGQAPRGDRGLRLPLEVQLLRGEAASQYDHLVCNLSILSAHPLARLTVTLQ